MNEAESESTVNTNWTPPMQNLGMFFLAIVFLVLVLLTQPFWGDLIVAAGLAALTRLNIAFLQRKFRFSTRLATALGILLLILLVLLAIPVMTSIAVSLEQLAASIAEFVINLVQEFLDLLRNFFIQFFNVNLSEGAQIVGPLIAYLDQTTDMQVVQQQVSTSLLFRDALGDVKDLIALGWAAIIILMLTAYMVADPKWARGGLERIIPAHHLAEISILIGRIIISWRVYVRGQLQVMVIVGLMVTLAAFALGLSSPLALGLIAAILEAIPTYGPILATIPALVVALVDGSRWFDLDPLVLALVVAGVYLIIQQIEEFVLTPRIHSRGAKFSPVIILISVLVGAHEFGILGAILAIPILASMREIVRYVLAKVNQQTPFLDSSHDAAVQTKGE